MMTKEQIDEIRARAETRLAATPKADTLALLDEVERLRARLREADAEVDRVRKHLSYETESRLRVQVILGSFGCECSTEQAIICLRCALVKEISTR